MAEEGDIQPLKNRKPRVRKPKAVETVSAAPESSARFVEVKPKKKSRHVLATFITMAIFACVVAAGAYYGWQQLMRVKQETAERDSQLGQQVGGDLAALQQKFDNLLGEWSEQRKENELQTAKKTAHFDDPGNVTFEYAAALGDAINVGQNPDGPTTPVIGFSGNPDITLASVAPDDKTPDCKVSLKVSKDGYCDVLESAGLRRIERAYAEYDDKNVLLRTVLTFSWIKGDETLLRLTADLGTPQVEGRDVFAPADADEQQELLLTYYRAILKGEKISTAVDENIVYSREIVASLMFAAQ